MKKVIFALLVLVGLGVVGHGVANACSSSLVVTNVVPGVIVQPSILAFQTVPIVSNVSTISSATLPIVSNSFVTATPVVISTPVVTVAAPLLFSNAVFVNDVNRVVVVRNRTVVVNRAVVVLNRAVVVKNRGRANVTVIRQGLFGRTIIRSR